MNIHQELGMMIKNFESFELTNFDSIRKRSKPKITNVQYSPYYNWIRSTIKSAQKNEFLAIESADLNTAATVCMYATLQYFIRLRWDFYFRYCSMKSIGLFNCTGFLLRVLVPYFRKSWQLKVLFLLRVLFVSWNVQTHSTASGF